MPIVKLSLEQMEGFWHFTRVLNSLTQTQSLSCRNGLLGDVNGGVYLVFRYTKSSPQASLMNFQYDDHQGRVLTRATQIWTDCQTQADLSSPT